MNKTTEKRKWTILAQIGIVSRGLIFTLMSILSVLGIFQQKPEKSTDSMSALSFLEHYTLGVWLLGLLAVGVFIYIIWRVKLTTEVSKHKSKWDKIRLKANHIGIALVYIFFLLFIVSLIFNVSSGGSSTFENYIETLLGKTWVEVIVAIIGISVFGKGIFQFYLAYTKGFLKLVKGHEFSNRLKRTFIIFGQIGYSARGFVFCILGFLIFRTSYALYSNPNKSVGDAMNFISQEFGDLVLLAVAIGFFIFSLFVFLKAKYRIIQVKG